jgi:ubiquinone/menaquinone biosynthesis C-methylase UbiE
MPSEVEQPVITGYLRAFANPDHTRILDIGCGRGHRTREYTDAAECVIGIDPNAELLVERLAQRSALPRTRERFVQAKAEALPFRRETFEVALLSWSF